MRRSRVRVPSLAVHFIIFTPIGFPMGVIFIVGNFSIKPSFGWIFGMHALFPGFYANAVQGI